MKAENYDCSPQLCDRFAEQNHKKSDTTMFTMATNVLFELSVKKAMTNGRVEVVVR